MSSYQQLYQGARELLKKNEIIDADIDAWYLMSHIFKIERADLLIRGDQPASEEESRRYRELVNMRAAHIPLQYLTGTQEFMGLEFEVTRDVLIPRQDTEILVEEVLRFSKGKSVLDMCTGSGCILVSIAKLGDPIKATGVDISNKALAVAGRNARKQNVEVEFILSDLFEHVTDTYDIIVSNPPYIPTQEIEKLMPEVRDHEPHMALDGNSDGLEFYRKIIKGANTFLKKDGRIFFEIGCVQGEAVAQLLQAEGFDEINIKKDLGGLDRVVTARRSF